MARLGVPVGGRVRKFAQWKINQPPSLNPKERQASLEGACISFDARNERRLEPAITVLDNRQRRPYHTAPALAMSPARALFFGEQVRRWQILW
jgi:hypothetical protein